MMEFLQGDLLKGIAVTVPFFIFAILGHYYYLLRKKERINDQ